MEKCGAPMLLVVEDDPRQLAVYATKLEEMGYVVHGATSAEDGIALVQEKHFDIILTDNILPGMTGLRSIGELSKWSRAPVFVMTSHYNTEGEKDALLSGARAYLKKPLDFEQLSRHLQNAVADSSASDTL